MKIQLSQTRIVPDALVVWSAPGPEVDVVMDLKALTFREGSIETIYANHVLDHLFPDESREALANWFKILKVGGFVHTIQDDFEYISRAFTGGDISPEILNDMHAHASLTTREFVVPMFHAAGFLEANVRVWLEGAPDGIEKKHYEFILSANRHA